MNEWKVVWTDRHGVHESILCGEDGVLDYLADVHSREKVLRPVVEILKRPSDSPSLSIVLGGDETVVTYEESSDPPYFISIGDSERPGVSPPFFHGGQVIEHLAKNLVPFASALRAVSAFLKEGGKPATLSWERL
jgi:hypothetical protein